MSSDTAMDFYVDALERISAGEYDQMYMWKLFYINFTNYK